MKKKVFQDPLVLLLISIIGALIAFVVSAFSYYNSFKSTLDANKKALESEREQKEQYISIIAANEKLMDSTRTVLGKQDKTLIGLNDNLRLSRTALAQQYKSIQDLEENLNISNTLLGKQKDLLNQQQETLMQVTGGDAIPYMTFRMDQNSTVTNYDVKISLKNTNKYAIRGLKISITDLAKPRKFNDNIINMPKAELDEERKKEEREMNFKSVPIDLYYNDEEQVYISRYDIVNNLYPNYAIEVKWLIGSYFVSIWFKNVGFDAEIESANINFPNGEHNDELKSPKYLTINKHIDPQYMEDMKKRREQAGIKEE